MQVRCPQCHTPVELPSDGELSDIACPSCGSSFSLLGAAETIPYETGTKTIGHFELVERIGVGTFGFVWKARDTDLDRTVAIKIPRKGQLDPGETEQFLREARAAAQLRHPNIVSVHEVGRDQATVFIVSDFVEGATLGDRLATQRFSIRESAELCAKIADALHHAHESGVIHRDLKPGNVILDATGEPHIMDFGLARREAGEVTMTVEGRVLGTPAYMSPEQAKGSAHTADRRSDVYSLGVILFEMLTGERPFRGNVRMLVTQVINDEPPSPRRLNGAVPRDLETICLKCMEKEPGKRLPTAKALADDLRRFLAGESVHARPISRPERLWRRCKRNPLAATLLVGVIITLLTGATISLYFAHVARSEAAAAQKAQHAAEISAKEARRRQYISDMYAADRAWEASNVGMVDTLLDRYLPANDHEDHRGFEWYYLWRTRRISPIAGPIHLPALPIRVAVSPDGRRMASVNPTGSISVSLWDLRSGAKLDEFGKRDPSVWIDRNAAFSADGLTLAYASADLKAVVLRDLDKRTERVLPLGNDERLNAIAFSPIDTTMAAAIEDEKIRLWDSKSDRVIGDLVNHESSVNTLEFSADGRLLASGHAYGQIVIWDVGSREPKTRLPGHTGPVLSLAFSPDGKRLASASSDRSVRVSDPESGQLLHGFPSFPDEARAVAFSPDDRWLAACGRDRVVRLWDAKTYADCGVIRDCMGNSALSFLPDGRLAYGTSEDQGVTICTIRPPRPDHVVASNQSVEQLALTNVRDGRLLACTVSSPTGSIRVWRVDRDELVELPPLKPSFVAGCVAATPTGLLALGDSEGHQVELYDLSRMQLRQRLLTKTARGAVSAAISTDGRRLAIGFRDGRIALWKLGEADAVDVISVLEFKAHDMAVGPLAFHPDASVLASGSNDQRLKVWNVADGAVKSDFGQQKGWIVSVGFSPDGRKLAATFFYAREVKIWRWPSAEEECTLRGHAAWIPSVAFLKDRRTLVSAGADRVVKIWDLESQQERLNLKADAVIFGSLAISPDEKTIAAGARDGTIRVFRAATEEDVKGRP